MTRRPAEEGRAVLVHGPNPARADEVARWAAEWGVDVLVNNAGPFVEHDWESAEPAARLRAMNGDVLSAVRMIRALTPGMRERVWGRGINVGSRVTAPRQRPWPAPDLRRPAGNATPSDRSRVQRGRHADRDGVSGLRDRSSAPRTRADGARTAPRARNRDARSSAGGPCREPGRAAGAGVPAIPGAASRTRRRARAVRR